VSKTYYCLYKLNKQGEKEYLTINATFKVIKSEATYKSLKKEKALGVREFVEYLKHHTLFLEEWYL